MVSQYKDQPALKIHEEDGHDDRHDEHHPGLGGVGRCRRHFLADELSGAHQYRRHIVGIVDGQVLDPKDERAVSELHGHDQHPEKSPEDRDLNQDGEAPAGRVDAVFLIELHHLFVHLAALVDVLLGFLVLGPEGLDLGLELLHPGH